MFGKSSSTLLWTAAGLVFLAGLVLIFLYADLGDQTDTDPAGDTPETTAPIKQSLNPKFRGKLTNAEGFDDSMKRLGIAGNIRSEVIKAFSGTLDFRRLLPGDSYSICLDEDDSLLSCVYESGPLNIYTLTKTANGFLAARLPILLEVRTVMMTGTVDSSIFNAFLDQGEDAKLVHGFANIFSSKIDFNTEPRQGDTFSLVHEKYYKNGEFVGYGRILLAKYSQQDSELTGFYFARGNETGSHFDVDGNELRTSFLKSPIPFGRVTSGFTYKRRHPILKVTRPHLGVDLAAPAGTPVLSASDGRVSFVGRHGGFGKQIIISHANGYRTHYGHLSRFAKGLRKGQKVRQKEIIGFVGSTGLSTGPHLDYRIDLNGSFKNPFSLKFKPLSTLKGTELERFGRIKAELELLMASAGGSNKILQVREVTLANDNNIFFL